MDEPTFTLADGSVLRPLDGDDGPAVQRLLESDPAHFEAIQGAPPGPAEAQSLFAALPPGRTYDDKLLLGLIGHAGEIVAVVDLICDHPTPGSWTVGTVFVAPTARRRSHATRIVATVVDHVRHAGATTLGGRAVTPAAQSFATATGFTPDDDGRDTWSRVLG